MVVSSPQRGENTAFLSSFPLGGIHSQDIFWGYSFGTSRKKHQPFPMTRPKIKILYLQHVVKNTQVYPYSGSKRNRLMKQAVTRHSCRDNTPALLQCHCKIRNPSFLKLSHASGCEAIVPHINWPWGKIPPSPPALPLGQMNFTIL